MFKIPQTTWSHPNSSDKFGTVWATRNINFDEPGYLKLSPRSVLLFDEDDDANFGVPLAFARHGRGQFQVMTANNAFNVNLGDTTSDVDENSGSNEPTGGVDSHGVMFDGRWFVADTTAIVSKAGNGGSGASWTDSGQTITNLVRHPLEVFKSRVTICVGDGNVVHQFSNSSGTLSSSGSDLTIPSEYEVVGLAYNNGNMAVITQAGLGSTGEIAEAIFYRWSGAATSAKGWGVGSDACVAVAPYKSSFIVLTREGQLLYFNGGGFTELVHLPVYFSDKILQTYTHNANSIMHVAGERVYINIESSLEVYGRKEEQYLCNFPAGVWCYDPEVGTYHRWSPSISPVTRITATSANTSTDVITAATGTVLETGKVARYIHTTGAGFGGLNLNQDYYIIKVTSSTFKLATSKINALAGEAVDITSNETGTSHFLFYDLVDYGQSFVSVNGAIGSFQETTQIYRDLLIGNTLLNTSLTTKESLSQVDPFLESRGWFITPKIFPEEIEETIRKIIIKFRPLKSDDKIVVKSRSREICGLPVSSPNIKSTDELEWTSPKECFTTTDLSDVEDNISTYDFELELTAGVGSGQTVKIKEVNSDSGTYSLVLEEEVIGAASGLKSHFVIDHWEEKFTITSDSNGKGYEEIPIDASEKWTQFKIELRGSDVTIEESLFDNTKHK